MSDIDTAAADGLKVLDPKRPIREADIVRGRRSAKNRYRMASFDYLVGGGKQTLRHIEAERLRGLEIDHKLKLGRLLNR